MSNGRHFAKCPVGLYDGLRVDTNGNVWTSTGEGVYCYAPDGTLLYTAQFPAKGNSYRAYQFPWNPPQGGSGGPGYHPGDPGYHPGGPPYKPGHGSGHKH